MRTWEEASIEALQDPLEAEAYISAVTGDGSREEIWLAYQRIAKAILKVNARICGFAAIYMPDLPDVYWVVLCDDHGNQCGKAIVGCLTKGRIDRIWWEAREGQISLQQYHGSLSADTVAQLESRLNQHGYFAGVAE